MFFNSITSISVHEAAERLQRGGGVLIDVRSREEYAAGHAVYARHMPLSALTTQDIEVLKEHSEVYVICQSGGRSSVATRALQTHGVNAINISGGTSAWHTSGLPMQ